MKVKRVTIFIIIFPFSVPAYSIDCEKYLRMHGFASRAQFQCGFRQYNQEVINQATACSKTMSETQSKDSIIGGMKLFDEREKEMGKTNLCNDIAKTLSDVVRK